MITREKMEALSRQGLSYAAIGKILGCSREWVRRKSDEFGLKHHCQQCKAEMESARDLFCEKCKAARYEEGKKRWRHRDLRTFSKRPVVWEAYEFFCGLGMDVVLDAAAAKDGCELYVNGIGVKCNAMVPVKSGHQVRLAPREGVGLWYLSGGGVTYVLPGQEVTGRVTYIGKKNPLAQYTAEKFARIVTDAPEG